MISKGKSLQNANFYLPVSQEYNSAEYNMI